jgi:hypothetical protein
MHVRRAASNTALEELQEGLVIAAGFIMSGSAKTRKTGLPIAAGAENPELPGGRIGPVQHGGLLRDKPRTRP